jgi:Fe-S-cluster-containing hydrogenase component 2
MKIDGCISCGNCQDFIEEEKCPVRAISLHGSKYKIAKIDEKLCLNCKLCKREINCLGESFLI